MQLAVIVFPELRHLTCELCGLGDAGAAKLAEGVALLPQLQYVDIMGNRIGLRGKRQLRGAWRRGGRPTNFAQDLDSLGEQGLRMDIIAREVAIAGEQGLKMDAIDLLFWGGALSLCAWCLTCGYCCGRFVGERKSHRVADCSLADSSSTMPREVPAALRMEGAPSGEGRAGGTLPADVP
ncbi:hypothetical protein T484DRAFT_1942611 [Baffinella frigidus]|nr:hypothetical protein T484DRAFT_1942611 [Cryptophyta sp. CCMP2293]